MAITVVGAEVTLSEGRFAAAPSITVALPGGIAAGDVLHVAVCLPRYRWWQASGPGFRLVRQYGVSIPTGWVSAGSVAWNNQYAIPSQGIMILMRKVATGAEGASIAIPLTRTNHQPGVSDAQEVLQVAATAVAHSGVNPAQPYAAPPVFMYGGEVPWNNGNLATSRMAQLAFGVGVDVSAGDAIAVGDPFPAWTDPHPTRGEPATWDVLDQASAAAVTTANAYGVDGTPSLQTVVVRGAVLDAPVAVPGLAWFGMPPVSPGTSLWYRVAFSLMDASEGVSVDPPPAPGQPGVTGSGWVQPEWVGREHQIDTPLITTVWGEGVGDYGPELTLLMDADEAPQAVGLEATFNGLGACTSAQVSFAANPGLAPYQHALKFELRLHDDPSGVSVAWWAGVVENVRFDNGLYVVDVIGFWALLNDARVQLDSGGHIDRPQHGTILDTLVVGVGDPTAVNIENEADEQQTWGAHLNNTFRASPDAAWGVGPDQVFIMGLPSQGGVQDLSANEAFVISVEGGEFILPPYVTEWWATDSAGAVVSAELTPAPGLLAPARLASSRLDDLGNLIMPKEAMYPLFAGPTHTLVVAGIAVPPLRAVSLPNGEDQMVASARVVVTIGEEGSMPGVTTTLTTVALPYTN